MYIRPQGKSHRIIMPSDGYETPALRSACIESILALTDAYPRSHSEVSFPLAEVAHELGKRAGLRDIISRSRNVVVSAPSLDHVRVALENYGNSEHTSKAVHELQRHGGAEVINKIACRVLLGETAMAMNAQIIDYIDESTVPNTLFTPEIYLPVDLQIG